MFLNELREDMLHSRSIAKGWIHTFEQQRFWFVLDGNLWTFHGRINDVYFWR